MNVPYLETGNGVSSSVPITARLKALSETKESSETVQGLGAAPVATQQASDYRALA